MELRPTRPDEPGITRRRHGRGFRYFGPDGSPLRDPGELARIKALVIPPAWTDVWICQDPAGHLQATGTDAAGRRQYRYHDQWRIQQDQEKFQRMIDFAGVLPKIRETVTEHLAGRGYTRERVLAAAVRLLDLGLFRAGGEEYAAGNGTYGLATLLREHVHCSRHQVTFDYLAKGAKQRAQTIAEPGVCAVVTGLKRRRGGGPELLAYREGKGWHDVQTSDINAYLQEISGGDYTAKDFRTWHATVLAAVGLAVSTRNADGSAAARRRAEARVVAEVAHYLGNTPAVARSSYIDPRVVEAYEAGTTVQHALTELGADSDPGEMATEGQVERAVRRLLQRRTR